MTFYNIIFGILFLGACIELFRAGFNKRWNDFCVATTIALLIFNDTLFTSHEIEFLNLTYSVWMKWIDLMDFLILTTVIVFLNPIDNFLRIKVNSRFCPNHREPVIWTLLTLYWLLGLAWNKLGNVYSMGIGYKEELSAALVVPFALMIIVSMLRSKLIGTISRWLIVLIVLGYILFKTYAYY